MARIIHQGIYVYDDGADQWTKHDTPELAREYAEEGDTYEPPEIDVASSSSISGRYVILSNGQGTAQATGPQMLVAANPARKQVHIFASNSPIAGDTNNGVIIGSRADVMSGLGFLVANFSYVKVETTAEIWAAVIPPNLTAGGPMGALVSTLEELER
jgi:hypothetical protein